MNLATVYQDFRKIYGFCPCCNELFHLSDAILFTRTTPPQTEFDRLDAEWVNVASMQQRLDNKREDLLERARLKGRLAAQKRVRSFLPFFTKQKLNIRDVKVLFDPVDYLAFQGLSQSDCKAVIFIDHRPDSNPRERFQKSLERAICHGNLEWQTVRIADDGTVSLK